MFANIIYVDQGSDIFNEVENTYKEYGYEGAIRFLSQWDYGTESEYDLTENLPNKSRYEDMYTLNECGDEYTLCVGVGYPDFALYRKVEN